MTPEAALWSAFLRELVGPRWSGKPVSQTQLNAALGVRKHRATGGDDRKSLYAQAKGNLRPRSANVWLIGEALRDCDVDHVSGPLALFAASRFEDFAGLFMSLEESFIAKELTYLEALVNVAGLAAFGSAYNSLDIVERSADFQDSVHMARCMWSGVRLKHNADFLLGWHNWTHGVVPPRLRRRPVLMPVVSRDPEFNVFERGRLLTATLDQWLWESLYGPIPLDLPEIWNAILTEVERVPRS